MNNRLRLGLAFGISAVLAVSIIVIPILLAPDNRIDYVKITVIVDNNPNGILNAPWGLSILVETNELTILFDSGPSASVLENNSAQLGLDLGSDCDMAVVSHEHPDHVTGLTYVSGLHDNLTLYTPVYEYSMYWMSHFDAIGVEDSAEISPGIFVIGVDYEQALVVNVKNLGLVVLVGCSHPGVENLVSKAIDVLNVNDVYMVLGGFHLLQSSQTTISDTIDALIDMGVQNIYPIHCSGEDTTDYLESTYPANYGVASVGFQIVLNGTASIP